MATLPLTYPDLVCLDDLDPFAGETTSDLQNLSQDVLHLLVELPGSNPDDPERGIGVMQYLSCSESEFRSLPGRIDAQLRADDRVQSSKTTLVPLAEGGFRVEILIGVGPELIPLAYGVGTEGVTPI